MYFCSFFQSSKNKNAKKNISGNKEDFLNTKQQIKFEKTWPLSINLSHKMT